MPREELEQQGYYSINKLSELLDTDRRTLKKRLATEAPDKVEGKSEYYQLDRVGDILDEASQQGSDKQKLECKKLVAQIKNIELRNDEIARRVISSEEVSRTWGKHLSRAKSALIKIEDLAPVLCGLDANQIKIKLREGINAVIEDLHDCPIDEPEVITDTK